MLIKKAADIRSSEITPQSVYLRRREFIQASAAALVGASIGSLPAEAMAQAAAQGGGLAKLPNIQKSPLSTTETPSLYSHVTSYNNFYEFAPGAGDGPKNNSKDFKPRPWKIKIDGHVAKAGDYDLDDFIKPYTLEERVYRFRCVEAWSFVIPWVGIPMAEVIKRVEPTSKARFVEMTTLVDRSQFPMQSTDLLDWPYIEGLRLDEAMNPLTLLAVGLYGEVLPAQNGAPIRLIVPWKYGFKGVKSIVRIRFVEDQPRNTWQRMAASEYGFYANVNPEVDHPRWSQARERRLPSFVPNRRTEMFNGYTEQVAHLYTGMDLRRNY
jgi:sulfoxide reductase catalytic subunit YedY